MKKRSPACALKNKNGQFVIEAVLLMVFTVSLLFFGLKILKDNKVLSNLISGPWQKAAGMIESGVWETADKAANKHPNQRARLLSVDPR